MEIIVGNKRYTHWIVRENQVEFYAMKELLKKSKLKKSFSIEDIEKVELFYEPKLFISPNMIVHGLSMAYPIMIRFITTNDSYVIDANTGTTREYLLEAIEYLKQKNIHIDDEYDFIDTLKDSSSNLWKYIEAIEKEKGNIK